MLRVNHWLISFVLFWASFAMCLPAVADSEEIERYTFETLSNGNVILSGFFKDKDDAFYESVVSQLKTGELLDVMLQVQVREEGVWGKTKSLFNKQKKVIHKRLSLDLLTDEVSLHRSSTYTTILPLEDLMPSILAFSHLDIIDKTDVKNDQRYVIDVALSFHRGTFDEGSIWDKVTELPRYAMRYIPETFLNPTLSASLTYKH